MDQITTRLPVKRGLLDLTGFMLIALTRSKLPAFSAGLGISIGYWIP
jgi:hypothetical protein